MNATTFTTNPTAKHLATTTLPILDCIWGQWVNAACSATCDGLGIQTRTRTKIPEGSTQGNECTGTYQETIQCTVTGTPCPGQTSFLILHRSLAKASLYILFQWTAFGVTGSMGPAQQHVMGQALYLDTGAWRATVRAVIAQDHTRKPYSAL